MKKQLILVFITISLFLASCCNTNQNENGQQLKIEAPATDDDDLIVLLYYNVIDTDYENFTYSFIHNKTPDTKVKLNNPALEGATLEPSFIVLNFGPRGGLSGNIDYGFKIEREGKDGKTELLDEYKNMYTYEVLKKLNSKVVIQSVKISFDPDSPLPIVITPPIKPTPQPPQ